MKHLFISTIAALLSFAALSANASVDQPTCSALEDLASKHAAWKKDFHRFQHTSGDVLSADSQRYIQRQSLKIVADRLRDIQGFSGHDSNNRGLLNDTTRFLVAYDRGEISKSSASYLMTSALSKFEDAIDDALFKAQVDSPNCDIISNDLAAPRSPTESRSGR